MQIREAVQEDITGILKVLKSSLGESSSKKTEAVWRYKHIDNPFGKSLVLVAVESGVIIGVRAFMNWKWQCGDQVFSTFRAVDTATHPEHQGKGIFKRLTMDALRIGNEKGYYFVFNTPNDQSKPGYLKMGWKEVGKLHTQIIPVSPIFWKPKPVNYGLNTEPVYNNKLLESWNLDLINSGVIFTPKSREYLEWRFINNPLQKYRVEAKNEYFLAGYVKKRKNFKELRISEFILNDRKYLKECKKIIKNWAKEYGVQLVTLNVPMDWNIFRLKKTGNFGPMLTFRYLKEPSENIDFMDINNWSYSLGDLELF